MNPADLHLVIPVHNRKALTRGCLAALAKQTVTGFTTIVVDDGSTDGTADMLGVEFPQTVLLRGDGSLWWSGATNLGVDWALKRQARWIMTLNDDTLPRPDFIEKMLFWAERTPHALIGAFAVDAESGKAVYGGERIRWLTAGFADLLAEIPPDKRHGLHEVTHYPGRGLLIPAEAFSSIGLFDARRFPQAAADYDFTLRARRHGFKIFSNHDAVLEIFPKESGDARLVDTRSVTNYVRHLFDLKGGGNLRRFVVFAVRNCPPWYLPMFLLAGVVRRVGGYPLRWLGERFGHGAPTHVRR
jgi:GT2 family glycosyltransferase